MDIDELIKKYKYKVKLEDIQGGPLCRAKLFLEELEQLKASMEQINPEVKKQGMLRVIWNKFKTEKDKI